MLFNSSQFIFFFAVIVGLYFSTPHRCRWVLLLLASYYFYMCWKPEYVVLIMGSTLFDYVLGLKIGGSGKKRTRKVYLVISILLNVGLLFAFKYYNFVNDSLRILLNSLNVMYSLPAFKALLPVGISFYTFQKLSYIIDVYRGEKAAERHLGIFALYVAFFPQLVAGPIERSTRLLPQFFERHFFDYQRVTDGLKLMAWGLFKKMVIADRIAVTVNIIYDDPTRYSGAALLFATYLFAFQIYCDFSGYSDIAVGAAQVLGFRLMDNFKRPYFAPSVAEFWRRWHISLSTWFRDYLYIPLGGSRRGSLRTSYNLLFVFLVCGMWHGAAWTFAAWGAFHGVYVVLEKQIERLWKWFSTAFNADPPRFFMKLIRIMITFNVVCLGWILFRANSITDAMLIVRKIFGEMSLVNRYGIGAGLSARELICLLFMLLLLVAVQVLQEKGWKIRERISGLSFPLRWVVYSTGILSIFVFGVFSSKSEFIYFQF